MNLISGALLPVLSMDATLAFADWQDQLLKRLSLSLAKENAS
jgi:hypothetical protein